MREQIEAKLKEAQEQQERWRLHATQVQQQLGHAQEQVVRWDAIRRVCGELLADEATGETG